VAKVIKQEQLEEIKNRWLYNESGTIEEAIQDIEVLTDQLEMTQAAEIRQKLAVAKLQTEIEILGKPETEYRADIDTIQRLLAACERKDQMLKSAYDRILDPTTPSIGADLANISAEVGKR